MLGRMTLLSDRGVSLAWKSEAGLEEPSGVPVCERDGAVCVFGNGALEATRSLLRCAAESPDSGWDGSFSSFCLASYSRMFFSFFSRARRFWNQF